VSTALVHAVLCVGPALALWVFLVLGRYPGEHAVAALAARGRRRRQAARRRRGPLAAARRRAPDPIACSLAGRAPPAATVITWFVPQT
jgi:hypothetical protein